MAKRQTFFEARVGSDQDPTIAALRGKFRGSRPLADSGQTWCAKSPLNKLLEPFSLKKFVTKAVDKSWCHFKAEDERRFEEYFSIHDFRRLISGRAVPLSNLEAIDGGQKKLPLQKIEAEAGGYADPLKLARHLFGEGGSLLINRLDLFQSGVSRLRMEFSEWTAQDIGVNGYFTPKGGQTFKWHWDNHDVFILQIEGQKKWYLHERCFPLPLGKYDPNCWRQFDQDSAKLAKTLVLRKGDVLYIPRGTPHFARSSRSDDSLHLTVGLLPVTWHDLVQDLLGRAVLECAQDIAFREPVRLKGDLSFTKQDKLHLKKLLSALARRVSSLSAEDFYRERRLRADIPSNSMLEGTWESFTRPHGSPKDAMYSLTSRSFEVKKHSDIFELHVGDKKIYLPLRHHPILDFMRKRKSVPFSVLLKQGFKKPDIAALAQVLLENCLLVKT